MASYLTYFDLKLVPTTFIPQMLAMGIGFSLFDVLRRIAIEETLKVE
jgi:hypothetical protein